MVITTDGDIILVPNHAPYAGNQTSNTLAAQLRALANVDLTDGSKPPEGYSDDIRETLLSARHAASHPRDAKAAILVAPGADADSIDLVVVSTAKTYLAALEDANDLMVAITESTDLIPTVTVVFAGEESNAQGTLSLQDGDLAQRIADRGIALL